MTPGTFEYHRPGSLDEAVQLLGRFGDGGRVLAGGHSLIPMMKLRLAEPQHLIDINGLDELKGVSEAGGAIVIGAGTTLAEAMASDLLASKCPIIPAAARVISDPQVRNCGTIGGNVANGDPGNDLPAIMMALGASYALKSASGERQVQATDFHRGIYDTAIGDGEMVIAIRIPTPAAGHGWSYQKMKRKVGDFAIAAAAVILTMKDGVCEQAAIALTNVGPAAINAAEAAGALTGRAVDDAAIEEAADRAMAVTDPAEDLRGPAEYRKHMAREMTRRAIREALDRAGGG